MKKLLFLPLLLLASCSVTPPTAPFKVGDSLLMEGTTKAGVKVSHTYPLKQEGVYEDGVWSYRFSTINPGSALGFGWVNVDGDGEYVVTEYATLGGSDSLVSMKTYCFAYPNSKSWRSAEGFLVHDTLANVKALEDQLDKLTSEAAVKAFLTGAGGCTLTRQ